jgi:hypothetical protein
VPNGNKSEPRKLGRPVNPDRRQLKEFLADSDRWSDRTFARAWRAIQLITLLAGSGAVVAALKRSTRPNESVNIAELTREAIRIQTEWDTAHPEEAARMSALAAQKRAARQRSKTTNSDRQSR